MSTYHTIRMTNTLLTHLLHLPPGARIELAGPGEDYDTTQFMVSIAEGGPDAIELTPVFKQDIDDRGCKTISFKEWKEL